MNSACLLIIKFMTWSKHFFYLTYSFLCLNQFSKSYPFLFQCFEISPRVYLMWGFHSLWDISSFSSQPLFLFMFINLPSPSSLGCIYAPLWIWVRECPELSIANMLEFLKKWWDRKEGVRGDRGQKSPTSAKDWFFGAGYSYPQLSCAGPSQCTALIKCSSSFTVFTNGKQLLGCKFTTFHLVSLAGDWYSWRNKVEKNLPSAPQNLLKSRRQNSFITE